MTHNPPPTPLDDYNSPAGQKTRTGIVTTVSLLVFSALAVGLVFLYVL